MRSHIVAAVFSAIFFGPLLVAYPVMGWPVLVAFGVVALLFQVMALIYNTAGNCRISGSAVLLVVGVVMTPLLIAPLIVTLILAAMSGVGKVISADVAQVERMKKSMGDWS